MKPDRLILMSGENLQLSKVFEQVNKRQQQAFNNLLEWHRQCKRRWKSWHSWKNRRTFTYHNNVDLPIEFKITESIVPYLAGNTLEPGCIALDEKNKEAAETMNQQIRYYNSTPEAKRALINATRWQVITGVGFIKDGWNLSQPLHRRWIDGDEELVSIARQSDVQALRTIAEKFITPEILQALTEDYQKQQEAMAQEPLEEAILAGEVMPPQPTPPPTEEEVAEINKAVIEEIKAFCSKKNKKGETACPNIIPQGNWFYTYDVDEYAAPAFLAVPTYDIAWLGIGDDIEQYEAIYHRYYISKHQLKRIQKSANANIQSGWVNLQYVIDHACVENTTSERVQQSYDIEISKASSVELIEETRRDEDGNIVITTICPGCSCVVRQIKTPFFHNLFNYTRLVSFPGIADLRGTSLLEVVESLCAGIRKQINCLLDNSDLVQNPAFLAKGAHLTDKQLSLYAGKIIDFQGEMRPLEIPDARAATQNIINYLMSLVYSMTGCVEVLDGIIPFVGNGQGKADLSDLKYSSTARLRYQLNENSIALAKLMERVCSNIMQFNREPRKVPVLIDGKPVYIDYKPVADVGAFRFFTDASSMVSVDPAVLRAQLTSLLNISDNLTIAHMDKESGQYVKRLLPSKRYLYKAYAQTFGIGNPENFMASPDSDEAIPSMQLPVMPQPPQPEAPPQGQMPPQGQPPMPEQMPQQGEADPMMQFVQELSQMPPEQASQILQQMPPEQANAVMQMLEQLGGGQPGAMPMDTGNGVTPEQAMAINTGDFSGQAGGGANPYGSQPGVVGLPPLMGGTQQMGSGRIIAPEQMAGGTNMSDIRQQAENLQ